MPESEPMKELDDFLDAKVKAATRIVGAGDGHIVGAWNRFMYTVPALVQAVAELEALYKAALARAKSKRSK